MTLRSLLRRLRNDTDDSRSRKGGPATFDKKSPNHVVLMTLA
jgi:hypothetical protein